MVTIKIKIFKAIDNPKLALRIFEEHNKRLQELNIEITSAAPSWLTIPSSICICAIDEANDRILGSARIQIHDNINPLPIEEAMTPFNIGISGYVNDLSEKGVVAEGCGLWCVKDSLVNEVNLSLKLYSLIFAVCRYMNIKYCIGLSPKHTLRTVLKAGFCISSKYPDTFKYPSERFDTYVIDSNTSEIERMEPETKHYNNNIYENPNMIETIESGNNTIRIIHEYLITELKHEYI